MKNTIITVKKNNNDVVFLTVKNTETVEKLKVGGIITLIDGEKLEILGIEKTNHNKLKHKT